MKSTEVYRVLREVIAPWCKVHGFKRTQGGLLGWYRQVNGEFLVFWCQCSNQGWDEFAGSKFVVEFQLAGEPRIGIGKNRNRLPHFLNESQLEEVQKIQNEIIATLNPPPGEYWVQQVSPEVREWYLDQFKPIAQRCKSTDDIWLRYKSEPDVRRWAAFVLGQLPRIVTTIAPGLAV